MKALNKKTANSLIRLFERVKEPDNELVIKNPDHPSLKIVKGEAIGTYDGKGYRWTIGILSDERNEKYAVLLEYIVIDNRGTDAEKGPLLIYPARYQDDVNDIQEDSIRFVHGMIDKYTPQLQTTHANFTTKWLTDLRTDGYIK